jgi:hypothetical protein
MSNEITASLQIDYANGFATDRKASTKISYNQTNQLIASGIQAIGASAESLDTADVGVLGGWLYMRNLNTTGNVTFGPDSSGQVTVGRIYAGAEVWFYLEPGVTLKLTSSSGTSNVQFKLFAA